MIKKAYTLKDFLPLITIFSGIFVFSLLWTVVSSGGMMSGVEIFMGLFFLVFGLFKILNLNGFVKAYQMYDVIAMRYPLYGYIYPFLEIMLGGLYIFGLFSLFTNSITLFIMSVSALGVYLKLHKKEKIMCACLGVVFKIPMTWVTLGENIFMICMALVMMGSTSGYIGYYTT